MCKVIIAKRDVVSTLAVRQIVQAEIDDLGGGGKMRQDRVKHHRQQLESRAVFG